MVPVGTILSERLQVCDAFDANLHRSHNGHSEPDERFMFVWLSSGGGEGVEPLSETISTSVSTGVDCNLRQFSIPCGT